MKFWAVSVATPEMMGRGRINLVIEALHEVDARIVAMTLYPTALYSEITISEAIAPPATWVQRA